MTMKEFQERLDDLVKHAMENPCMGFMVDVFWIKHFKLCFMYNDYMKQIKIRFYSSLNDSIKCRDYVPSNIEQLDAYRIYQMFKEFVESAIDIYNREISEILKTGGVNCYRKGVKK